MDAVGGLWNLRGMFSNEQHEEMESLSFRDASVLER